MKKMMMVFTAIVMGTLVLSAANETGNAYLLPSSESFDQYAHYPLQDSYDITMAKGEVEHYQLVLPTSINETVTFTPETSAKDVKVGYRVLSEVGGYMDALVPFQGRLHAVSDLTVVWLTFETSRQCKASTQTYSVRVKTSSVERTLHFNIYIADVEIPLTPSIPSEFCIHMHQMPDGASDRQKELWNEFLLDRRIDPYWGTLQNTPIRRWDNSFSPWSWDDPRTQKLLEDKRYNHFALPCLGGDDEFTRICKAMKEKGLFDRSYFYIWDEPLTQEAYNQIVTESDHLLSLEPEAKMLATISSALREGANRWDYDYTFKTLSPAVKIFPIAAAEYKKNENKAQEFRSWVETNGGEWWTYVCCQPQGEEPNFLLAQRPVQNRAIMWRVWKEGETGFLYWGVNHYLNYDKYNKTLQFDGIQNWEAYGDGALVFPGEMYGIEEPVASVRLERWRDGQEDYELLHMLEQNKGRSTAEQMLGTVYHSPINYTRSAQEVENFHQQLVQCVEESSTRIWVNNFHIARGEDIVVNYAHGGMNAKDYIAVAPLGQKITGQPGGFTTTYDYLDKTGAAKGTCSISAAKMAKEEDGYYWLVYLLNDGYEAASDYVPFYYGNSVPENVTPELTLGECSIEKTIITFTDSPLWRALLQSVSVDGVTLHSNEFTVSEGVLTIYKDITLGKVLTVKAVDHNNVSVILPNNLSGKSTQVWVDNFHIARGEDIVAHYANGGMNAKDYIAVAPLGQLITGQEGGYTTTYAYLDVAGAADGDVTIPAVNMDVVKEDGYYWLVYLLNDGYEAASDYVPFYYGNSIPKNVTPELSLDKCLSAYTTITFTDSPLWRALLQTVSVDGVPLYSNEFTVSEGVLTIHKDLTLGKVLTVKAIDHNDVSVFLPNNPSGKSTRVWVDNFHIARGENIVAHYIHGGMNVKDYIAVAPLGQKVTGQEGGYTTTYAYLDETGAADGDATIPGGKMAHAKDGYYCLVYLLNDGYEAASEYVPFYYGNRVPENITPALTISTCTATGTTFTFTDNLLWRTLLQSVSVDGQVLKNTDYVVEEGSITIGKDLTKASTVTIKAIDHDDAIVSLAEEVTIGASRWATFYTDKAVTVPTGVKVYVVKQTSDAYATLSPLEDDIIPSNTAVLLNGDAQTCIMRYSELPGTSVHGNLLQGSLHGQTIGNDPSRTDYVLGNGSQGLGFYISTTVVNTYIPAHKAYLSIPETGNIFSALSLRFDGDVTKVTIPVADQNDEPIIYNLEGKRVNRVTTFGLYIVNGKKRVMQ